MSTLTQFLGGTRSATFINTTPSNSVILPANDDPGALTANVWKTVLSLSSGGILHAAAVRHGDATSRTVGIRITIDGVQACSFDEPAATTQLNGGVLAGYVVGGGVLFPGFAQFRNSLLVEIRSSDTNTAVRHGVFYTGTQ